jgi:hypothetical protein
MKEWLVSALAGLRRARIDLAIVCGLWMLAYAAGTWYIGAFRATGAPLDGTQRQFAAAVGLACGRGFIDIDASTPGLTPFLSLQTDAFSCDQLPAVLPQLEPNVTQRLYRYLMSAEALIWMVRGRISWSGLVPMHGILYAFTIVSAYGIFRSRIRSRWLCFLLSSALIVSAIHVSQLVFIRDYAKAPFILALLLVMAWMARGPATTGRLLGLAAAFGLILGVGFGFRNDLLINVPPFLAVVFLCLDGSILKNLGLKLAAVALAAAVFAVVAWPILKAYGNGSNSGHVALLGLVTPFDEALAIRGSMYDWGYKYEDGFASTTINSYSYRVHGYPVAYLSKEYDRAAVEILAQIARHWPADMLVRAYASVLKVVQMPFTIGTYTNAIPLGASGRWVDALYDWQMLALRYLAEAGIVVVAAALVIVSSTSLSGAFALLAFLLYYAGYPAIQFHVRHFFHLEFIAWFALGFVVERVTQWLWTLASSSRQASVALLRASVPHIARAGIFAVTAAAAVMGGLSGLRLYQQSHVGTLLSAYAEAPRERMPTTAVVEGEETLVSSTDLWAQRPREEPIEPVSAHYLVAEFSGRACGVARLPVTLRYEWADKSNDFSRDLLLPLDSREPIRVFFPAYYNQRWSYFAGVTLPTRYADCLTALSRVDDRVMPPLLLDLTFTPRWREQALYQTLASLEAAPSGTILYVTAPERLALTRRAIEQPLPVANADVMERAPIVTPASDGGWTVRGRPAAQTTSFLRFRDRPLRRGDVLVVRGEARRGGFVLGLQSGGQWAGSVEVNQRGPFVAAVEAPSDGNFTVLVRAALRPHWPATYVGHRIGPWVEWLPGATLWSDLVIDTIGFAAR